MAAADRQHMQMISQDRYYIGRGEQNPLAEDMHHEVNYLGQELCSGTHILASSACAYT
jgi:sacsin